MHTLSLSPKSETKLREQEKRTKQLMSLQTTLNYLHKEKKDIVLKESQNENSLEMR